MHRFYPNEEIGGVDVTDLNDFDIEVIQAALNESSDEDDIIWTEENDDFPMPKKTTQ